MSDSIKRNEALLKFFNELGYQPILVAKSDLVPPEVYLLDEEKYRRYGALRDLLDHTDRIPEPVSSVVAEIERIRSKAREARIGFSFFQQLLELLGLAGYVQGAAGAAAAGDTVFRFGQVTSQAVDPGMIELIRSRRTIAFSSPLCAANCLESDAVNEINVLEPMSET